MLRSNSIQNYLSYHHFDSTITAVAALRQPHLWYHSAEATTDINHNQLLQWLTLLRRCCCWQSIRTCWLRLRVTSNTELLQQASCIICCKYCCCFSHGPQLQKQRRLTTFSHLLSIAAAAATASCSTFIIRFAAVALMF